MSPILPIHIAAGSIGIITGTVALFTLKGATTHRRAGIAFVVSMSLMAGTAIAISLWSPINWGNVFQGLLTIYMVVSAMYAVRPRDAVKRRVDVAALLLALGVAVSHTTFGVLALNHPDGQIGGYNPPMFFIFGSIAWLGVIGDVRMLRAGELRGPSRLVRHFWRMCFALFLATGSFFLGQADEFPEALRIMPALTVLALFPLPAMLYWLWRVRIRRSLRGLVGVDAAATTRRAPGISAAPSTQAMVSR